MGIEILSFFVPYRSDSAPTPALIEKLFADAVQWDEDAPDTESGKR
jgi:hypothetical protein